MNNVAEREAQTWKTAFDNVRECGASFSDARDYADEQVQAERDDIFNRSDCYDD